MKKNNAEIKTVNALDKVFFDGEPCLTETRNTLMKNEVFSFQVCVKPETTSIKVKCFIDSDINEYLSVRFVDCVPARNAKNPYMDDYVLEGRGNNELYPDILRPYKKSGEIFVGGGWQSIWITVDGKSRLLPVGKHIIKIRLYNTYDKKAWDAFDERCVYTLEIIDGELPKIDIINSRWFHYDCICDKHNVKPFSERFYNIFGNYLDNAVKHGMNMLYVPLFTPALDTAVGKYRKTIQLVKVEIKGNKHCFDFSEVKRFLDFVDSHGIKYFEFSHLATQWGAEHPMKVVATMDGKKKRVFGWEDEAVGKEYLSFLEDFTKELKDFLIKNKYLDRVFFHISDEPPIDAIDSFRAIHDVVVENIPNAKFMDALSHEDYYRNGLINYPFAGISTFDDFRADCIYYCGCMCRNYETNCHLVMPLQRIRVLGLQMYRNATKGFLQWGYNYYYSMLSEREIDPYSVTDAGGAFEAGDSFVVYPYNDGVINSIRYETTYDAFQDYALLKMLEMYKGADYVELLLENEGVKKNYKDYPRSAKWQIEFRARIHNEIIAIQNSKQ